MRHLLGGARPILIACPNLSLDRTMAVDGIRLGHVHRSTTSDVRGGGKGVNVARALACVGARATVVGLAAGRTGEAVVGLLEDEGLDVVAVPCHGETRSCLTVLGDGDITVFNESGPELDAAAWERFDAEMSVRLPRDGVFVCSGSFPPGAPADGAARLLAAARSRGCTTVCDASGPQLANALGASPDVVCPNLAEAAALLHGGGAEPVHPGAGALERAEAAAAALAGRGPGAVVVTAGAAGAAVNSGGRGMAFAGVGVDLVNPVGAGDCLVAGVALGLASGIDVLDAAPHGIAMASASCETLPAGLLDPVRSEELLTQVCS